MPDERYQSTGKPLTDEQREVLVVLMEECAEVIQAVSKLLRFGIENYPPDGPLAGTKNNTILGREIGDLEYMVDLATGSDMVRTVDILDGRKRKAERFAYYRQSGPEGRSKPYSSDCGASDIPGASCQYPKCDC